MSEMSVRDFGADHCDWAAKLMERRRQIYAGYSPVFWRPAAGVAGLHAKFLCRLAANPANMCLRTECGFIIGQMIHAECFVDDFALDEAGTWGDDGRELLGELWARVASDSITTMRVVTAEADRDKVAMLAAAGLALFEQWWVKPLHPRGASEVASGRVGGPGFSGLLGPAPPVYDPGGPVLLVDQLDRDSDLGGVEEAAATMGAVLAIVSTRIDDNHHDDLIERDWTVASQWYLGQPKAGQ